MLPQDGENAFAVPVAPSGVDFFTNPLFTHDVYNLVQSDNLRLLLLNQDDRRDCDCIGK